MNRFGIFLAATAAVLGIAYAARPKGSGTARPKIPGTPRDPSTPAPQPSGGWEPVMNQAATTAALIECKMQSAEGARSAGAPVYDETTLRLCALEKLFPDSRWEAGALHGWQGEAWARMGAAVSQMALTGWTSQGFPGVREMAVKFWLGAYAAVGACRTAPSIEAIRLCAARELYPDEQWPPAADAPPGPRQAWEKLAGVVTAVLAGT